MSPTYYLGCFADYTLDRDLKYQYINTPFTMTIQFCLNTCLNLGYALVGLQQGYNTNWVNSLLFHYFFVNKYFLRKCRSMCFCSNSSYGKYGLATSCNVKCTGDAMQICGSISANSIYKTNLSILQFIRK